MVLYFAIFFCSFSEHDFHNRSVSVSKPEDLDAIESDWLTRSGTVSKEPRSEHQTADF